MSSSRAVSLPSYKEVGSSTNVPGVKDVLNLVVVLILDLDQGRGLGASFGEGVWEVSFQEADMEYQVQTFESQRELDLVGVG